MIFRGTGSALDVAYAGSGNGTNIQIHDANDSVAQKFACSSLFRTGKHKGGKNQDSSICQNEWCYLQSD